MISDETKKVGAPLKKQGPLTSGKRNQRDSTKKNAEREVTKKTGGPRRRETKVSVDRMKRLE